MMAILRSAATVENMLIKNSGLQATMDVLHGLPHATMGLRSISSGTSRIRFEPGDPLKLEDLNSNVLEAKYAVRGKIPARAMELERQLSRDPDSLPFKKIIYANIGNPQQLGQKPLSFSREVLSLLESPNLLQMPMEVLNLIYKPDAVRRAKRMMRDLQTSIGAYSHSQGVLGFRKTVAEYLSSRDGEPASAEDIFLTTGASNGASLMIELLCKGQESGVLIPIPQYPLYTATITLNNTVALPYYLDEESGWSLNIDDLERIIIESIEKGVKPACLVVINPGNPTGAILPVESMERIFVIAAKYSIVVIADEVYQENVFEGLKFYSMKKVLRSLQRRYKELFSNVQLVSLHSTSKGLSGECGQRGGYMELVGFSDDIREVILKMASIQLCSPVGGQALVDLMLSRPKPGDESYERDLSERSSIRNALQERSKSLWETFNNLEGVECRKPQGSMYLFPRLVLPQKAIKAAESLDMQPDEFYCTELLNSTGICTVPGSGFGQAPDTCHLRTTFLCPGTEWIESWELFHKSFYDKYRD
ncbi:alanine transaminase ALT2 Ecym_4307 [Eremothecium cymbalariae DBVPG|uniref:Aminotransferase class I/classII large domain-containing protein n=1 Tax=Eremothecium cymbalariae (strain CBS 270.75 / DBVPG 7215 / KCTC 17166 / NRRL Y-17582) TaxID=931890 RepID=G8JTL7_ERECY|nr:hypothetical protein Ecym_4307 [Eremothecium cymbalariae DBVPG\